MGRKYIKDLPQILSPSFDGYFIYDDGTTTYKGTINGLYDKFSPYFVESGRTITAGSGMTGGGILTDDITFNINTGNDGITINLDNITLNTVNNLTTSSTTRPLSATQGKYLFDNKVGKTGDTMSGILRLNNELNLNGYVRLSGAEPGLILRMGDNSDFADITAKKFIKNGGTGGEFLMADGSVTTSGATTSYYDSRYVNVNGDTMSGELTINNNLNLNGDAYVTGIVNIEGNLAVFGDIGDDIDKVYRGYFNNLYGNFISGKTIYSSGDLNVEDNVRISGYTDMFDTLAIHNADLLIGGYLGYETEPVSFGYFNEIIALSGITGETIYSNSNININGLLGLSGYVKLQGDESGLMIRDNDGTDWRDIRARSIIKHLGTGAEYLMADGSVTTSGATTSYYDSRYVNVSGDTIINPVNTPSTSSSPGVSGQISWDTNNLYLCVGVNTWKKISLETF